MNLTDVVEIIGGFLGGVVVTLGGVAVAVKALKPVAALTPTDIDDKVLEAIDARMVEWVEALKEFQDEKKLATGGTSSDDE